VSEQDARSDAETARAMRVSTLRDLELDRIRTEEQVLPLLARIRENRRHDVFGDEIDTAMTRRTA